MSDNPKRGPLPAPRKPGTAINSPQPSKKASDKPTST